MINYEKSKYWIIESVCKLISRKNQIYYKSGKITKKIYFNIIFGGFKEFDFNIIIIYKREG